MAHIFGFCGTWRRPGHLKNLGKSFQIVARANLAAPPVCPLFQITFFQLDFSRFAVIFAARGRLIFVPSYFQLLQSTSNFFCALFPIDFCWISHDLLLYLRPWVALYLSHQTHRLLQSASASSAHFFYWISLNFRLDLRPGVFLYLPQHIFSLQQHCPESALLPNLGK